MTKLAIIDLDGVVANPEARFAKAEAATGGVRNNLYWQTAFTPEYVALDTLIEGAIETIEGLEAQDYEIIYLTSRPESMRAATIEWLWQVGIYFPPILRDHLVCKSPAFQFVKTIIWKAGMVYTLAALYEAEEILVIDDEQDNISEIMKYAERVSYPIKCYRSLKLEYEPESSNGNPF
jgi:phosphoglycolate phosphatase-like HAD superfamily hydrolase